MFVSVFEHPVSAERPVECLDKDGFDFRAGELLAGSGQLGWLEVCRFAAEAGNDDVPDGLAFRLVGQVHEELSVDDQTESLRLVDAQAALTSAEARASSAVVMASPG